MVTNFVPFFQITTDMQPYILYSVYQCKFSFQSKGNLCSTISLLNHTVWLHTSSPGSVCVLLFLESTTSIIIGGGLAKVKMLPAWTEGWTTQRATASRKLWTNQAPWNMMGGDSTQYLSGGKQHPTETEICLSHKQKLFSTESLCQKSFCSLKICSMNNAVINVISWGGTGIWVNTERTDSS